MAATYTITKINFSSPPSVNQVCSVFHKKTAEPDSAYVLDSATVAVQPNGTFVSPFVIPGLDYSTSYTFKVVNNCGGAGDTIVAVTPADPCPDITGITGTTGVG